MEKSKMLISLIICLITIPSSIYAMGYRTGFNNYKIVAVENLEIEENAEKVWNLTYEGSERPITVIKKNTSGSEIYIVRTEFFEACYGCTSKGFGTRSVKRSWSRIPCEINEVVINNDEMKRQRIISPDKVDENKALELIACYLPNLLNEEYVHLLN